MSSKQLAIDAVTVLNYLVGDMVVPVRIREDYAARMGQTPAHPETAKAVNRFCLSQLVLALSKWLEFYDHYARILPRVCVSDCKALNAELKKRELKKFRNTVVGHIWNKENKRPLSGHEIEAAFQSLVNGDADVFVAWCNSTGKNTYPNTIVSIVERVRDEIIREHGISEVEIVGSKDAT